MMQSNLFGRNRRAAPEIFYKWDAFLPGECRQIRRRRGLNETAHEKVAPMTAVTRREIQLYIIIGGGDVPEDFTSALGKRRAPKVRMNDDSGAVDHRLNSA